MVWFVPSQLPSCTTIFLRKIYLGSQWWIWLRGRVLGAGVLGRQLVLGLLALQPLEQEQLGGGLDGVVL